VYARLLLNSLDWQGRENTLGLVRQLLRNQGQAAAAFLEVQVGESEPAFPECRFYAPMNVADLKASLAKLGLEAEEVPPQPRRPADGAIPTQRVKVRALP
jgi:hypothetical protein